MHFICKRLLLSSVFDCPSRQHPIVDEYLYSTHWRHWQSIGTLQGEMRLDLFWELFKDFLHRSLTRSMAYLIWSVVPGACSCFLDLDRAQTAFWPSPITESVCQNHWSESTLNPTGKTKSVQASGLFVRHLPLEISSQTTIKRLACPQPEPFKHRLERATPHSIFYINKESRDAGLDNLITLIRFQGVLEEPILNCQHVLGIPRSRLCGAFHFDYFPCTRGCFAVFKTHQAIEQEKTTRAVESTRYWEYISLRLSSSQERHKARSTIRKNIFHEAWKSRGRHS